MNEASHITANAYKTLSECEKNAHEAIELFDKAGEDEAELLAIYKQSILTEQDKIKGSYPASTIESQAKLRCYNEEKNYNKAVKNRQKCYMLYELYMKRQDNERAKIKENERLIQKSSGNY